MDCSKHKCIEKLKITKKIFFQYTMDSASTAEWQIRCKRSLTLQ